MRSFLKVVEVQLSQNDTQTTFLHISRSVYHSNASTQTPTVYIVPILAVSPFNRPPPSNAHFIKRENIMRFTQILRCPVSGVAANAAMQQCPASGAVGRISAVRAPTTSVSPSDAVDHAISRCPFLNRNDDLIEATEGTNQVTSKVAQGPLRGLARRCPVMNASMRAAVASTAPLLTTFVRTAEADLKGLDVSQQGAVSAATGCPVDHDDDHDHVGAAGDGIKVERCPMTDAAGCAAECPYKASGEKFTSLGEVHSDDCPLTGFACQPKSEACPFTPNLSDLSEVTSGMLSNAPGDRQCLRHAVSKKFLVNSLTPDKESGNGFHYNGAFDELVARKAHDGSYRTFRALTRDAKNYPKATYHPSSVSYYTLPEDPENQRSAAAALEVEEENNAMDNLAAQEAAEAAAAAGKPIEVWCSNDYMGMSRHPEVLGAVTNVLNASGVGAGGTRNIAGNGREHELLETDLANLHDKESALLFSSCFVANDACLSTLGSMLPDCIYYSDEDNHASMIQGIRNGRSQKRIWKHNDVEHLDQLLSQVRIAGADESALINCPLFFLSWPAHPLANVYALRLLSFFFPLFLSLLFTLT